MLTGFPLRRRSTSRGMFPGRFANRRSSPVSPHRFLLRPSDITGEEFLRPSATGSLRRSPFGAFDEHPFSAAKLCGDTDRDLPLGAAGQDWFANLHGPSSDLIPDLHRREFVDELSHDH